MAATSWDPNQPQFYGTGSMPKIVYQGLEANSQSFKAGSVVYANSGAITACAADAVNILGIAMVDATNVTSGNIEIPVMVFEPHTLLRMKVTSGATEATNSETSTAPFVKYAPYVDANGVLKLDTADTGVATKNSLIFIQGIRDVNGDATAWAEVKIASHALAAGGIDPEIET